MQKSTRRWRKSVRIEVRLLERKAQRYLVIQPWYEYDHGPGGWGSLSRLALVDDVVTMTPALWEFMFGQFVELQETAPAASVAVSVDGLDVVRALATVAALELGMMTR